MSVGRLKIRGRGRSKAATYYGRRGRQQWTRHAVARALQRDLDILDLAERVDLVSPEAQEVGSKKWYEGDDGVRVLVQRLARERVVVTVYRRCDPSHKNNRALVNAALSFLQTKP